MAIDRIKFTAHTEEKKTNEILHTENIERHLCAISEELFKKELEVGSGEFSRVYRDTEAGIVYKKTKPLTVPKNDVYAEADFLKELSGIDKDVIVPFPVVSFIADIKRDKDSKPIRQSVLAMQEIKGFSLDRLLPKKPGAKPELSFPKSFSADTFFPALKTFVEKMHNEKNIYHCDLFSRNIMIEEKTGKPVVIDFGNAVHFSEEFAVEGEIDAYGNRIVADVAGNKIPRTDLDLANIANLEFEVREFLEDLTKEKDLIY